MVADIESCTSDIIQKIPNGDPSPVNIKCKHDFYMSFHVEVTVNSDLFATAIDVLMSGDLWPELRHTGTTIFQERQQNGQANATDRLRFCTKRTRNNIY